MNFTVLDDTQASLVCNDCITEEQLEIGYSETELGSCDECGARGKRLYPSLPSKGIIIGWSMVYVEAWARAHGLNESTQVHLLGTDNDVGGRTLEGMCVEPECVVLLPGSERGRYWHMFERQLMAGSYRSPTAQITASQIASGTINSFQMNIVNNVSSQQWYNKYLYGTAYIPPPKPIVMTTT